MDTLALAPLPRACGNTTLPGSKSISNRILLLSALAEGHTCIHGLLDSDDTRRMLEALAILGVPISPHLDHTLTVSGIGGKFPTSRAEIFLGNAGTAFRPLTAALAFTPGEYTLTGITRMHERPIGDLVDALRQLGAHIDYLQQEGYPPLRILPAERNPHQHTVQVRGDVSSQFLTALLMALPLSKHPTTIEVIGELISKPYIDITLQLMARFGIQVERENWQRFIVPGGVYHAVDNIYVEGDASSASYFLAAGLLGGGPVEVRGVGRDSIQGDVRFTDALAQMGAVIYLGDQHITASAPHDGVIRAITLDCNAIPDAAMTLAVCALFAQGTTTLCNIASWRVKETDRITAMATELRKLGATVETGEDFIRITPPQHLNQNVEIDTYDDHRMAMCFSLVAFKVPVIIRDPNCVSKTFPNYFQNFEQLRRA